MRNRLQVVRKTLQSDDAFKCLIAALYLVSVVIFLACIQVLVHHRMPTNEAWNEKSGRLVAPLPDLVLDWLPATEWGLKVSEICISLLTAVLFVVILTHKHWLVVLRRFLTILATIYLIRAFCLVVTSPTPSSASIMKRCSKYPLNSFTECAYRAWTIFISFGMELRGGETCGDYIFSGHTSVMTLSNLFIVTYIPRLSRRITISLIIMLCTIQSTGVFFILLSHEHYTVDIILGVVISYAFFTEYHLVTRYIQLTKQTDHHARVRHYYRLRIVSPLTFYMEINCRSNFHDSTLPLISKHGSCSDA